MGRDFRRGEVAHHSLLRRLPIVWFSLSFHTSPVSRIEPWPICRRSSMPFGMSLAIRISWPNASRGTKGKQCHGFSPVENPSLSHVWEKSLKKGSNRLTKVTLMHRYDMWYVMLIVTTHTDTFCMLASSIKFFTLHHNEQLWILHPDSDLHETSDPLVYLRRSSKGNGWSKLTSMTWLKQAYIHDPSYLIV